MVNLNTATNYERSITLQEKTFTNCDSLQIKSESVKSKVPS